MGNRQTKEAKPQTGVTQSTQKLDPETEPSTVVKRELPVAVPETPPQPSEPSLEPPLEDSSPTEDTTQVQEPPLEDPAVEDGEIKEQKESEKELLEPLPVLLNDSESVEEKLKKSEESVHVVESVTTEQNDTVLVTAPVTDQEVIFEDPVPITSEDIKVNETKETIKENETKETIKENETKETIEANESKAVIEESKIEDVSKMTSEMTVKTTSEKLPEAVLLDSQIAVCKEETSEVKNEEKEEEPSEVKNEDDEEEEIADSKTPSIAMETASVSSSAIKMDEEYMKGIMGTSLAFPDATSNESVIGSLAVSEQTLDESLWDNTGPCKSSMKCPPPPCKEDSLVSVGFEVIDQTIGVVLTTLGPIQEEDQKKHEMIPEETLEHELPEVEEVQSKPVLDHLDEEIPAPEKILSTSKLDQSESFVSIELHEENDGIKVGMNCVSKIQIASSNSMISDKQMSVELKTPFENVEDDATTMKESKSGGDALSNAKSSEKSKTKKPKKSTSMKSTGSGVEGDSESTNAQMKANSGQIKVSKSLSSSAASGRGKGSRGRGKGRKF